MPLEVATPNMIPIRRHNINYNCIEDSEVDGTIAAQRTTKIEGLHFG